MKKPNRKHKNFVRSILAEKDRDVIEYRMMNLEQVISANVSYGWTSYASFTLWGGKRFRSSWRGGDSAGELKKIFRDMLTYWRKQRK